MAIATRQLGNEAQSPIAGQQPPIVGLQAATVNRQSTCRAAKFVRRHVAIVIAAHNHFPAHYDFIDRSKKSAEVRMSDCRPRSVQKNPNCLKSLTEIPVVPGFDDWAILEKSSSYYKIVTSRRTEGISVRNI